MRDTGQGRGKRTGWRASTGTRVPEASRLHRFSEERPTALHGRLPPRRHQAPSLRQARGSARSFRASPLPGCAPPCAISGSLCSGIPSPFLPVDGGARERMQVLFRDRPSLLLHSFAQPGRIPLTRRLCALSVCSQTSAWRRKPPITWLYCSGTTVWPHSSMVD